MRGREVECVEGLGMACDFLVCDAYADVAILALVAVDGKRSALTAMAASDARP
jgi:hypothetical protein